MAVSQKTLPEYFDESNLQFDAIHQQLEQLEAEGFIRLVWKTEKRAYLGKMRAEHGAHGGCLPETEEKAEKAEGGRDCQNMRGIPGKGQESGKRFLDWVQSRIEEGASIRRYVDEEEPEAFDRLCRLILQILSNQEECFLRQVFHPSFSRLQNGGEGYLPGRPESWQNSLWRGDFRTCRKKKSWRNITYIEIRHG